MTRAQLRRVMSNREFVDWVAFNNREVDEQKKALDKNKTRSMRRGRRR